MKNNNAFLIHISSFTGYMFPFGNSISPLILWQTLKEKSSFLYKHGKQAINFNSSYALYIFVLSASFITLIFSNFFEALNTEQIHINDNSFGIASVVGLITFIKIALIIIHES